MNSEMIRTKHQCAQTNTMPPHRRRKIFISGARGGQSFGETCRRHVTCRRHAMLGGVRGHAPPENFEF